MTTPRQPSLLDWLGCTAVFLLGLCILGTSVLIRLYGTTPEDELTLVEGMPHDILLMDRPRGTPDYLKFGIGEYRTEYSRNRPRFEEVLAAIESGEPLRMWVSTKQETLFPRQGWVPLYKLNRGERAILTYEEVVANQAEGTKAILIVGFAVTIVGLWGVYLCYRRRRGHPGWAATQRTRIAIATAIMSILFYGIMVGVPLLDAKAHAKMVEAFGTRRWGLPIEVVLVAGLTLWYIPMPLVFWHALQLAFQAGLDRRTFGLSYLLGTGQHHPELRRSQLICLGGILYVAILCTAWIVYAEMRGI